MPKSNIGLHFSKAAEDSRQIGKFLLKTHTYKPRAISSSNNIFKSKSTETICYLKKVYLHHYLFEGLPCEFLVPSHNKWDIHPITFTNQDKAFIVLAESDRGPIIIEFFGSIIATTFHITNKR